MNSNKRNAPSVNAAKVVYSHPNSLAPNEDSLPTFIAKIKNAKYINLIFILIILDISLRHYYKIWKPAHLKYII